MNTAKKLAAEGLGTMFLLATVVGSGIMGESLAQGNDALALLGNSVATGSILAVLITVLGPISGAPLQSGGDVFGSRSGGRLHQPWPPPSWPCRWWRPLPG